MSKLFDIEITGLWATAQVGMYVLIIGGILWLLSKVGE